MNDLSRAGTGGDAWNPGIESQIPRELLHLATIFRPENVFTDVSTALELRGLTGFALSELVAFRPERLALHELLIRVTADFAVPDGSRIGDLGINFREIARRLLTRHVAPNLESMRTAFTQARTQVALHVQHALTEVSPAAVPPESDARRPPTFFARLARRRLTPAVSSKESPRSVDSQWGPAEILRVEQLAGEASDATQALVLRTLARVMSALFTTQGHAWGTRELIVAVTTDMATNTVASQAIGRVLDPLLRAAGEGEDYRLLPRQERPVVINTKGASASGKSTLRPLQKLLAGDIGVDWQDFALISPDIWRKQLLDYDSLGAAYKYAGAFSAEELQIVDTKLDRHMAEKNAQGDMPHLLIDRFRFDSFAADSAEAGSNLLTRFGAAVYLFFVITPPEQLVVRAWNRGLEFGRFKAVDDTLAHAVDAYSGIPDLFFTWVNRGDKRLRFEFLDNSVSFGERPRTVAFGDNVTCNVLDVPNLINIDRFARTNVTATAPAQLFTHPPLLDAQHNLGFLRRCVATFRQVNFADPATGAVYLHLQAGIPLWKDGAKLSAALQHPDTRAGLLSVVGRATLDQVPEVSEATYLQAAAATAGPDTETLQWASRAASRHAGVAVETHGDGVFAATAVTLGEWAGSPHHHGSGAARDRESSGD